MRFFSVSIYTDKLVNYFLYVYSVGMLKTNFRVSKIKIFIMKKIFTILTVVALATTTSFSQAQFGIKVGFNNSAIGSSDSDMNELISSKSGMQFGGIAMFELSDAIQLRTGAIYSQKGATLLDEITVALDYLEVPADFAFMLGDGGFSLSAGPYFAFLMSSKYKFDGESEDMEDMNSMDLGLNFGASYLINEQILIDARYGMGLMNLDSDSDSDETILNGALQISVGYMFGGGY